MGALRRAWIVAGLGAGLAVAGAVAGAVLLGGSGSARPLTPTTAVSVRASFTPSAVQFGDHVTARVVVLLDRDAVRTHTLRIVDDVAPLTALGSPHVTRTTRGRLEVVSYEVPAACLSEQCVADSGVRRLALPKVEVDAARSGGGRVSATATWPALAVAGRVGAADLAAAAPPFRTDLSPPPARYRVSPSALALLLDALAGALALAGLGLAGWEAASIVRRRGGSTAELGALERALRLARGAGSRPAPDRRRAVGLLARLLGDRDRALAGTASDLAWSRPEPAGSDVTELVDEVERTMRP